MNTVPITTLHEIKAVLGRIDLLKEMEQGFIAYSEGRCVIPPVGELVIDDQAHGEVHIKYGYERGGTHYVIKIASGFPGNKALGLPGGNGMMLLFDLQTGQLTSILADEAHLTDVRTGAAGALACRLLAPSQVDCIGIIGTGVQGREQLKQCAEALGCTHAIVCGRTPDRLTAFTNDFSESALVIETTTCAEDVARTAQVIVTCTSSHTPLLKSQWIKPGTHITAIGSDTPEKQELETAILADADSVVVDSLDQARLRGEVSQAFRAGVLEEDKVVEIGAVLSGASPGRQTDDSITVADLTGVAIQDLRIAQAVTRCLENT